MESSGKNSAVVSIVVAMTDGCRVKSRAGMILRRLLCLSGIAVLAGCAINPATGRNQLMALPAVQSAHANMGYTLSTAAAGLAPSPLCAGTGQGESAAVESGTSCPGAADMARFLQQVQRTGAGLSTEAQSLAPEVFARIGAFDIAVQAGVGEGTSSSAGGRIVLASGLAALHPTDDVVAFLIAREMGHVIARHGEENSGARLAFSALTAVVPIGGLMVKFAASLLGSQALQSSWAERQRLDADEIALVLLERSGRTPDVIAFNLRVGLKRERLPQGEWGSQFARSMARVTHIALARPQGVPEPQDLPGPQPLQIAAVK